MSKKPKDRPTVELVDPSYQPSKAEKEEEISLPNTEGKTPRDVARALTRTVEVGTRGSHANERPASSGGLTFVI